MSQRAIRQAAPAWRRRLLFERCEDRLALDASALVMSLAEGEHMTAEEGGTVSVSTLVDHADAPAVQWWALPIHAMDGDRVDGSSVLDQRDVIADAALNFDTFHGPTRYGYDLSDSGVPEFSPGVRTEGDVNDRVLDLLDRTGEFGVAGNTPLIDDASEFSSADAMARVPVATPRSAQPNPEGGAVDVATMAKAPIAWAVAQHREEVNARAGLAALRDAESLRMRAIHFEVAHSGPAPRQEPAPKNGDETLTAGPASARTPADLVSLSVAAPTPHSAHPDDGGTAHAAPRQDSTPERGAPTRLVSGADSIAGSSSPELKLTARGELADAPSPAPVSIAQRDAALAGFHGETLTEAPAEPVALADPWRRETVGLAVAAVVAGEWTLGRRRLTGGGRALVTEHPRHSPPRRPRA